MDSSPTASSILDTLRTVEFRLGIKGYNVDEVDEYLDRAAQEAEALQENLRQLNDRLRQAGDRIVALEKEVRESARGRPHGRPGPGTGARTGGRRRAGPRTRRRPRWSRLPPTRRCSGRCYWPRSSSIRLKRESESEAAATVAQAEAKARATVAEAEQTRQDARVRVAAPGARRGGAAGGDPQRVGHRCGEHGPASRVGAQPPARGADRDPQLGGRERAADQLPHGRAPARRPSSPEAGASPRPIGATQQGAGERFGCRRASPR